MASKYRPQRPTVYADPDLGPRDERIATWAVRALIVAAMVAITVALRHPLAAVMGRLLG